MHRRVKRSGRDRRRRIGETQRRLAEVQEDRLRDRHAGDGEESTRDLEEVLSHEEREHDEDGVDLRGIAVSGGSACQSGSVGHSHVLLALGVSHDLASAAIRMSLGCLTTDACIDRVSEVFPALVNKARQFVATS